MKRTLSLLAPLLVALGTSFCLVAPSNGATIDGTVSIGEYGTPLAVQDTPTGFGDTNGVDQFGSELNALYANLLLAGGLELALTGNLENFSGNSLVIFLDVRSGGAVNSILSGGFGQLGSFGGQRTDDWGNDVDGSNFITTTPGGSSILDAGFNPDLAIEINAGGDGTNYFVNIVDMTLPNDLTANIDVDQFVGSNLLGSVSVTQAYVRNDLDMAKGSGGLITHALDNSNVLGVTDMDASGALTATTGMELLLSSEFLAADPGQTIKLLPFITNANGEYLANQFLPGLGGVGNLGNPGGLGGVPLFDAREFGGDQFISIPEPSGALLLILGAVGVVMRRRRA
jgi:hypothetical protein